MANGGLWIVVHECGQQMKTLNLLWNNLKTKSGEISKFPKMSKSKENQTIGRKWSVPKRNGWLNNVVAKAKAKTTRVVKTVEDYIET